MLVVEEIARTIKTMGADFFFRKPDCFNKSFYLVELDAGKPS